ncbi:FAD-binding PCMH-type domain-containing protein OS=Streptomyces tendae OX=1932 GN=GUR47_09030 PE=4 SV=1 [Streptomyces tendae]
MTVLHLADEGEAADLAAFLSRLLHYDRSAAVRLQAAGTALAVFGRPPSFEVLAVRAVRLAKPYENGLDATLDVTVSAGELLETVDERTATSGVPDTVTGPPWAGVLPPRGGWRTEVGLPAPDALRALVAAAVAEFRTRTGELAPEARTRAELDRVGREIWSRSVGDTGLPVRAVHAAQSLGFLRPRGAPASGSGSGEDAPKLLSSGAWLRLRTPFGSVALRRAGTGALGISVR